MPLGWAGADLSSLAAAALCAAAEVVATFEHSCEKRRWHGSGRSLKAMRKVTVTPFLALSTFTSDSAATDRRVLHPQLLRSVLASDRALSEQCTHLSWIAPFRQPSISEVLSRSPDVEQRPYFTQGLREVSMPANDAQSAIPIAKYQTALYDPVMSPFRMG